MITPEPTWSCHVCGSVRPDSMIAVFTTDLSAERGMPPETLSQNVRYCRDNPRCVAMAKTKRLVAVAMKTPLDNTNEFDVGVSDGMIVVLKPVTVIRPEQALRLIAWLILMVDPDMHVVRRIVEEIKAS
jgi:hypothetical protein